MGTAHPPRMNADDPEERAADATHESEPCIARTCPNPRKCLGGNHSYSSDPWHHRRPAIVLPLPPCPARAIECSVPVPVPITITTITRRSNDIFYRHLPLSSHLIPAAGGPMQTDKDVCALRLVCLLPALRARNCCCPSLNVIAPCCTPSLPLSSNSLPNVNSPLSNRNPNRNRRRTQTAVVKTPPSNRCRNPAAEPLSNLCLLGGRNPTPVVAAIPRHPLAAPPTFVVSLPLSPSHRHLPSRDVTQCHSLLTVLTPAAAATAIPLPETSFSDKKLCEATLALMPCRPGRLNPVHAVGPEEPGSPPLPSNLKPADARARAAPSHIVPTSAPPPVCPHGPATVEDLW